MSDLFIASTPLNVLSAAALANRGSHLVVYENFDSASLLTHTIQDAGLFDSVQSLPGKAEVSSRVDRWRQSSENVGQLEEIVSDVEPTRVHVSSFRKVEEQAAVEHARAQSPDSEAVYVEGGVEPYCQTRAGPGCLNTVVGKFLMGTWRYQTSDPCRGRGLGAMYLSYPDLIRPELKRFPHERLELRSFRTPKVRNWLAAYAEETGLTRVLPSEPAVLFSLPHSDLLAGNPGYLEHLARSIRDVQAAGSEVMVKYHPRETTRFVSPLTSSDPIHLPRGVPVEVAYLLRPEGFQEVVGDLSMSLLTASWMLADGRVTSLAAELAEPPAGLVDVFTAAGIRVPEGAGGGVPT